MRKPEYAPLESSSITRHNIFLVCVVAVMCLTAGAFYHAFNQWTVDGKDRSRIHVQEARYRVVRDNSLRAGRVVDIHNQQQDTVDSLREQVESFHFNDSTPITNDVVARYQLYNDTIRAANETCSTRIVQLTAIVAQLVNATNSTPTNVFTGLCEFNGAGNETETVDFTYDVLYIGGLDFFYYQFSGNTSGIVVGTTGARIENCVPPIFQGGETTNTVFRSQLDDLVGYPQSAQDYVASMRVRDGGLDFIPVTTAADPLQTLGWVGTISVFLSVF